MQNHTDLWTRLEALDFDVEGAAFPFAARLARDNNWSEAYSARVIDEYRRFVFLAVVAGHEVTPSDAVDQAWHLHLTYTRHYWGVFTDTIGVALHHGPTSGGATERARYADNYARTLASYAHFFGAAPPADIWPDSEARFTMAAHMRRVDLRAYRPAASAGGPVRRLAAMLAGGVFVTSAAAALGLTAPGAPQARGAGAGPQDALGQLLQGRGGFVAIAIIALVILLGLASMASRAGKGGQKADSGGGFVAGDSDGDGGCGGGCGGCGS